MVNSKALTKIQSIIMIATIVLAVLGGAAAYILLNSQSPSSENIKIGVMADLDTSTGRSVWQALVLASEQLNDEGGIRGRQVEVIGEDTDASTGLDPAKINLALTRLLTVHKVDFVIGTAGSEGFMVQEIIAQHKKIFFEISATQDVFTQRVLDDYDKCKYYFRVTDNASATLQGMINALLFLREQTGFNKIGYIGEDIGLWHDIMEGLEYFLPEIYGFDLVYRGAFPLTTVDFSSYFAQAEAAGVEIMLPLIVGRGSIPFVKEYTDRQSPMVIYGGNLGSVRYPEGWEATDGKCEYTSFGLFPAVARYPYTSKTLPDVEAYIDRWNENPGHGSSGAYDILRYILPDAIERAGTLEVDAVIQALETTNIETTNARNFAFTSSHDMMLGDPNKPETAYAIRLHFQWQNGELVPVFPKWLMEEAGTTYKFPPWPGPWD